MRRGVLLIAALVLLAMAAVWLWRSAGAGDPGGPRRQWFYDLRSRQLFPAPMGSSAPIAAPGDGEGERNGVLAVVVKTPSGPAEIAYLMTGREGTSEILVRAPDGEAWIPERSPQAEAILARARRLAGGGPVALDFPIDR